MWGQNEGVSPTWAGVPINRLFLPAEPQMTVTGAGWELERVATALQG